MTTLRQAMGRKVPSRRARCARRPAQRHGARSCRSAPAEINGLGTVAHRLLHGATTGLPRVDYLASVLETLLRCSDADLVALWLTEDGATVRCSAAAGRPGSFRFEKVRGGAAAGPGSCRPPVLMLLDDLASRLHSGAGVPRSLCSHRGNLVVDDLTRAAGELGVRPATVAAGRGAPRSLLLARIRAGNERAGVFALTSRRRGFFADEVTQGYERLAPILGHALVSQRAQAAVHERVKELTCLYEIGQLAATPGLSFDELLRGVVAVLPPAWQYPQITAARVVLDGCSQATPGFRSGRPTQSAEITVGKVARGCVHVTYLQRRPTIDEGPFLKEERNLIDAVAQQLALVIERREAAAERSRLQEQLRHADRLATIGQLAAGAAHELNEPLANVLGFAQLAKKGNPAAASDLDKIVAAALHAREVVRKLMLFARQAPPSKAKVNLNSVITEGLYLIEARCSKQGVELVRRLEPDLPEIVGDPSQLHQVLVNLVVNAVQAMPNGGTLTIRTGRADDHVRLIVEDTGCGMSEEVRRRIFMPFFTTKDVNEGTGLGLSVVHGIVSAHGGRIAVSSEPRHGSRFEVELPLAGTAAGSEEDPDAILW